MSQIQAVAAQPCLFGYALYEKYVSTKRQSSFIEKKNLK